MRSDERNSNVYAGPQCNRSKLSWKDPCYVYTTITTPPGIKQHVKQSSIEATHCDGSAENGRFDCHLQ